MVVLLYLAMCKLMLCKAAGELTAPVETQHGPVQGEIVTYDDVTIHRFLSIPYAAPPVDDLRFAPPVFPDPWTASKDVSNYGNRCMSDPANDFLFYYPPRDPPPMGEDCLHLTVIVPQSEDPKPKAVMVYIHGGGLLLGSSNDYPPESLAIIGDVIVVSINYRLHIFGYLASEKDTAPGNVGFLDQVMALKWVKTNIAAFGGDPERITIFGESAGSWSVSSHLISPLSKGLFTRAIAQSGSLYGFNLETIESRAEYMSKWAEELGCTRENQALILECLKKAPADELIKISNQDFSSVMTSPAIYGDIFLPETPTKMYDTYKMHSGVDLIAGITSEEAGGMPTYFSPTNPEEILKNGIEYGSDFIEFGKAFLMQRFRLKEKVLIEKLWKIIVNQYFKDMDSPLANLRAFLDLAADQLFTAPTLAMAQKTADSGSKNNVYFYYFDETPNVPLETYYFQFHLSAPPELEFGANHGFDLYYMFAHPLTSEAPMSMSTIMEEKDKAVAKSMVKAWTTFAKTGKPEFISENGTIAEWPMYDEDKELYLLFKHPMTGSSVERRLRPGAADFWNVLLPAAQEVIRKELQKSANSCICTPHAWYMYPICCRSVDEL